MLAARLVSDSPMETSQILVPVELQHVQPDILEAYADSTILRSKCEADVYVELFSTVTGQICRSLGDGEVQVCAGVSLWCDCASAHPQRYSSAVAACARWWWQCHWDVAQVSIIDGDSWTEAAPGNMSTVRELLKSDEASWSGRPQHCILLMLCSQQPGILADAGSLPPKQSSSWSETRCKRPHYSQAAGRWHQLWSGLAHAGCQCYCGPRPMEHPATPYDKQREMCQWVLAPVCAQGGQARLPDLSVHDKNDTFHWQGASYSTFRLMGRCPNTEIQPAISHKYPHYKDELTRLKYIGSITAQRLRDVQAHLDCNVPFTCIETVEQMKHLMMFADTNRLVENKLLELLNFRGKHKHKWDYLRATLNHIVYDDNAHRAWLLPEGGSDPGSLGLLFACRQGQVNLDKPAGVIYRVPHPTGAGHSLQVVNSPDPQAVEAAWRRSAEQAWLTPGHPGWGIAQDPMEFVSCSGGLGAPGRVSPALSGHDAMDESQACLMRRTSAASSPLPRLVNPLAAMQLSLGLRAGAGLLGGSTNSDPAACTGSEAATAPHHSRSSSLRRVGSVRSNGYAGSDGLQYTVSEAGMDPMLRHSRVSNGSTGEIQAREHPTGPVGYGHGMDAPGSAGLPPLSLEDLMASHHNFPDNSFLKGSGRLRRLSADAVGLNYQVPGSAPLGAAPLQPLASLQPMQQGMPGMDSVAGMSSALRECSKRPRSSAPAGLFSMDTPIDGMDVPLQRGQQTFDHQESRSRHLPQSQRSQEGTLAHVFDVDACDPDFLLALDASAFDVKELTSAMQYHGNLNSPGAHFSEALSLGLGLDHGLEQHGIPGLLGSAGQHMQHAVQQASNSGSVPGLEPGPGLQPREMSFAHFAMGQAAPDPGRATTGAPFHQFPLSDSFTQTLRRMMHHFDAEACKPEHTMHPGDGTPAA
ncbi:uncharacterized protein HaLaN_21738 [Haematococcus lacustris]|uniref:Uncharacterized protein n=1 Tax=Haematococcus lacustris TaxID=44745 RepID=A0A699ZQ09_HAELA|nr:uncharacterized protein HaLaN_21738 [Haematococcus lacustris]